MTVGAAADLHDAGIGLHDVSGEHITDVEAEARRIEQLAGHKPCPQTPPPPPEDDTLMLTIVGTLLGLLVVALTIVGLQRVRVARDSSNTTFLSHSKKDGGSAAAALVEKFDASLLRSNLVPDFLGSRLPWNAMGPNFIDTENLKQIDAATMVREVKRTRCFVLLLTRQVLTRPWCLLEIYTAIAEKIPVVPVLLKHQDPSDDYSFGHAADFLSDLPANVLDSGVMRASWGVPAWGASDWSSVEESVRTSDAEGMEVLDDDERRSSVVTPGGASLSLGVVQDTISKDLQASRAYPYEPSASKRVREAQMADIVDAIRYALKGQILRPDDPNIRYTRGRLDLDSVDNPIQAGDEESAEAD